MAWWPRRQPGMLRVIYAAQCTEATGAPVDRYAWRASGSEGSRPDPGSTCWAPTSYPGTAVNLQIICTLRYRPVDGSSSDPLRQRQCGRAV